MHLKEKQKQNIEGERGREPKPPPLTLAHAQPVGCVQVCRLRARSAQELLDQRGAELLQAGPTHARGGAGPQPVDQDQLFGREAELGDRKSNRKSHSNPALSSCCRNLT